MSGPTWDNDEPEDVACIGANSSALLSTLVSTTTMRVLPRLGDALAWHQQLYAGCTIPVPGYVGHFRGDASVPELIDYEVGIGSTQPDGWPDRVGVFAADLAPQLAAFETSVHAALSTLDPHLPAGSAPTTVGELAQVVQLSAVIHGEWIRLHPFANGNGRTARVWAAFVALRYGLPVFVTLKPRPHDVAYAAASRESMGRPPSFVGNHEPAVSVFGHLLTLSLLPP